MRNLLFSSNPQQALRMFRHLSAVFGLLVLTFLCILFHLNGLFQIDIVRFNYILVFFWIGIALFTLTFRLGLNVRFEDPSLTMAQMLWGTSFLLTMTYLLNEYRGLTLMAYFGLLSFGFFKLRFREFLSISMFAILGYALIILYLFLYDQNRIDIKLELFQLLAFICTITVMLFTGSSIHRLRDRAKRQRAELEESLELNKRLATTDELTGLYNRRHFMEILSQQKALSERDDSDFVVCFCDLDYFKKINDTFGHHTGDVVLKKFSEILKTSIREIDYAARFGGEEFVCLLVHTDMENCIKVTERIRESLANYNFSDIAPSLQATVSIGLANFKAFNTIQETLVSADHRMYQAKNSGRNKVISSDEDVAE